MRHLVPIAATLLVSAQVHAAPLELTALRLTSGFDEATLFEDDAGGAWGEGRARQWSAQQPSGATWRVVEVELRKPPRGLGLFLRRWRATHGCTAQEVVGAPALLQGERRVPQLTFEGTCEAGDRYAVRVLLVGTHGYELHVDARLGQRVDLHAELRALMGAVVLRTP